MKQNLPDYIKQNDDLRQLLLSQEGGIMKYLADHLDANGTAALFTDYQNQCVEEFFEKNKWDIRKVWVGDEMRRAALGEMEHLWKEVRYQRVLNAQLTEMSSEASEMIEQFTELYLDYAYKQHRLRWHPNGLTDLDIYREVIEMYTTTGLAYRCMELILREHHAMGNFEKTESDLWTEFLIRQWSDHHTLALFGQMRQAVAEMLIGKTDEQCRQMAIDTMERLRVFSQKIYSDVMVQSLRNINFTEEADQRERDGEWLRDIAKKAVFEEFSSHVKQHSMRYYYANFVNILMDVGRIWAAQLKIRDFDMHELEKETCCILNPTNNSLYYIDKYYSDDLPGRYCISNYEKEDEEDNCDEHEEEQEGKEEPYNVNKKDLNIKDWELFKDSIIKDKVIDAIKTIPTEIVGGEVKRHFIIHKVLMEIGWLRYKQSTRYVGLMKYKRVVKFNAKSFQDKDLELFKKNPTDQWDYQLTPGSELGENYRLYADMVRNTFTRIIDGKLDDIRDFYYPGKIKYNQVVSDNS